MLGFLKIIQEVDNDQNILCFTSTVILKKGKNVGESDNERIQKEKEQFRAGCNS